jgi:hypothetical protein
LRNADRSRGDFYLGIPPGPQNGHVLEDQNLVIWSYSQNDQIWDVPDDNGGGEVANYFTGTSGNQVCITVAADNFHLIDHVCDFEQYDWQLIASTKVGKGNVYPGCFIFWNINTSKAMGVQGASMQNGTAVVQWTYTGAANQFWCEV